MRGKTEKSRKGGKWRKDEKVQENQMYVREKMKERRMEALGGN